MVRQDVVALSWTVGGMDAAVERTGMVALAHPWA